MVLDHATAQLLAGLAKPGAQPLHSMTPAQARAGGATLNQILQPGPEMVRVVREYIVSDDAPDIPARVYYPSQDPAGILLYFHGGGWVLGNIDEYDSFARNLAADSGFAVAMVNYRKAPEARYPAAVCDAWLALEWTVRKLVARPDGDRRLVVGGDSAGGNLAAVVVRRARDLGAPHIDLQLLVYPITDCDTYTDSYLDPENQLALSRESMLWFWNHYAPEEVRTDPDISPLRVKELAGLPPAVVVLAEHDVLRSEGEAYCRALQAAGVDVDLQVFTGQIHGFLHMVGLLPMSAEGIELVARQLIALADDTADSIY